MRDDGGDERALSAVQQVRRMFRDAFPGRDTRELLAGASLTFEEFSALMR